LLSNAKLFAIALMRRRASSKLVSLPCMTTASDGAEPSWDLKILARLPDFAALRPFWCRRLALLGRWVGSKGILLLHIQKYECLLI
jgi:hypothetical protein